QQGSTSKKTRQGLPQYWKFHQHDLLFVRQTEIQLPTVFHIEPLRVGVMVTAILARSSSVTTRRFQSSSLMGSSVKPFGRVPTKNPCKSWLPIGGREFRGNKNLCTRAVWHRPGPRN
ncbi:hypothetical protein, partial [Ferrovum myxofaciens]|uniref:hypothetical protein n=1 Tax=Ferrovum myxofaciens TaxID=416213 RepID=UPI001F28DDD2